MATPQLAPFSKLQVPLEHVFIYRGHRSLCRWHVLCHYVWKRYSGDSPRVQATWVLNHKTGT